MGAESIHREVIRSPRMEPWGNGRGRERIQQRSLRRSDWRGGWGTRRFSGIQKEKMLREKKRLNTGKHGSKAKKGKRQRWLWI